MHVYHYAAYERTALTRLMGEHATREDELDDLLRGEVLVDLFRVTKQALRASVPSYSIKEVEALYGFERTADVGGGAESVEDFERWLEIGEQSLLDGIRDYNREDCVSLYELHRWLLGLRPDDLPWRLPPDKRERTEEAEARDEERDRVRDALLDGAEEGDPDWLLGQILDYHQREARPQWWAYFNNLKLDDEELIDGGETLGGLELDGEPVPDKKSLLYPMRFPPQEHKIGREGVDPATEKSYAVAIDNEHGTLTLRRGAAKPRTSRCRRRSSRPQPLSTWVQRDAVLRFAKARERLPGARRDPRAASAAARSSAARSRTRRSASTAATSSCRARPARGRPGTARGWRSRSCRPGRRVGVTALSHKAIHKFLEDVEEAAVEAGFEFRGMKKASGEESQLRGAVHREHGLERRRCSIPSCSSSPARRSSSRARTWTGTSTRCSSTRAGSSRSPTRSRSGRPRGTSSCSATRTSCRRCRRARIPTGANASVARAPARRATRRCRPSMGVFLEETWRMRPEVNAFISESFYEGRLEPAAVTSTRSVADGAGVRFLPVEHTGHATAAPEEARGGRGGDRAAARDAVHARTASSGRSARRTSSSSRRTTRTSAACARRSRTSGSASAPWTSSRASRRPSCSSRWRARPGRTCPRGLEFLFSRNRLNVAVSRARCLAYVVANPRLLEASCRTVEQMRLANALCRFVELAEAGPGPDA